MDEKDRVYARGRRKATKVSKEKEWRNWFRGTEHSKRNENSELLQNGKRKKMAKTRRMCFVEQ